MVQELTEVIPPNESPYLSYRRFTCPHNRSIRTGNGLPGEVKAHLYFIYGLKYAFNYAGELFTYLEKKHSCLFKERYLETNDE